MLLTAAAADIKSENLDHKKMFKKVREKFGIEKKTVEELEKEIDEVCKTAEESNQEKRSPKGENSSPST